MKKYVFDKEKFEDFLGKIIVMTIVIFVFMLGIAQSGKYQYMNKLDYQVTVNEDGSMMVVETWDINIRKTNTLFKNFNLSSDKYGNITDVKVVDLDTGKELEKIDEEMYHVTKDFYYALETQRNLFEIAWGVGMDNKSGNKKYQVSYLVNDVVTDYKDVQEIYWQFLAENQNAIPVKKVTGTITLPEDVNDTQKLRVWGHGPLNGEIEKVGKNKVEFKLNNLNPGAMLEIRVVTEDKMFEVSNKKIRNYNYLDTILKEENKWAEEANESSKIARNTWIIIGIIYLVIILIFVLKIIKYNRINKEENNKVIKKELKYFRDIPREKDVTPIEAAYLYNFEKERLATGKIQRQAVSATILDLCFKKIISLSVKKENVYVKILQYNPNDLKKDELEIFNLIKEVGKDKEEFKINELNKYAKKKYRKYSNFINRMANYARNSLYELKLIDKVDEKLYEKYKNANMKFVLFRDLYEMLIVAYVVSRIPIIKIGMIQFLGIGYKDTYLIMLLLLFPIVGVMLYSWKLQERTREKIAVLTQAGSDEKEQWKGLANYMKDFSLLNKKEIPELVIWEKYLVYATAFGIADRVIEQIKALYPEVNVEEQWKNEQLFEKYPIIYFSTIPTKTLTPIDKMSNNVNRAYNSSTRKFSSSHSTSSGFGGGGGFSGGGGGRRWPEDGMGGR